MWIYRVVKLKWLLVIFAIFLCCELSAKGNEVSIKIYFDQGSDVINDRSNIQKLVVAVDEFRSEITTINILGYCSAEGSSARNRELSRLRAEAVKEYLVEELGVADSIILVRAEGVAWARLESIVQNQQLLYSAEVEAIIEGCDEPKRNAELMKLDGGEPYSHLFKSIYPLMRYADVAIHIEVEDPDQVEATATKTVAEPLAIASFMADPITENVAQSERAKPLMALKTNMLFDLATLINIELEIPIQDRWSIAAEYIFPWWVFDNHKADSARNRIQLLNGNLEGRYWWGDRSSRPILTGWFTGVYAGVGSYDFEYDAKGYQGEFFVAAGVSGGYAHTINRAENLRLEYSLGVGYISSDYKHYHAEFCNNEVWHAVEQSSGRYSWFGPTRAKISLSWLINCNAKK